MSDDTSAIQGLNPGPPPFPASQLWTASQALLGWVSATLVASTRASRQDHPTHTFQANPWVALAQQLQDLALRSGAPLDQDGTAVPDVLILSGHQRLTSWAR